MKETVIRMRRNTYFPKCRESFRMTIFVLIFCKEKLFAFLDTCLGVECGHNAIISVNILLFDERYMFSERHDHESLLVCLALASSSFKMWWFFQM